MDIATDKSEGMRKVYYDYQDAFRAYTNLPLSQFFDVSRGGFLTRAFTTQVLEYEGKNPGLVCYKMFGKDGQNLIASIMHDCAEVMNDSDTGG